MFIILNLTTLLLDYLFSSVDIYLIFDSYI